MRLRERREERGDEGGFTLIELLIVIVILGILAAIVVFAVQNLTSQSAKASCGSDYKTLETAVETYKAQVGHYPALGTGTTKGDNWAATPGGGQNAGTVGDTTPAPGALDGVEMLYTTQTGVDGSTVGAWLKDAPTNGSLYRLWIVPSTDGSLDSILVQNLAKEPLPTSTAPTTNLAAGGSIAYNGGNYKPQLTGTVTQTGGVNDTCSGAGLG